MTAVQDPANTNDAITTARNAQARGDNAVAEFNFARAVQMSPDEFQPKLEFGVFLASIGRYEEAKTQLHQACGINPGDADTLHNLGELSLLSGEFGDAVEQFETALTQDPDYVDARYGLARAYRATRQFSKAQQAIDGCLKQSASDPDFLHLKALIASDTGDLRQAIAILNALLTNSPQLTDAVIDLANFLSLDSHVQEAAEMLDDVLDGNAVPAGYLTKCAGIYLRANRNAQAKRCAQDALTANEGKSLASYWLARIHGNEGDFNAAEKFALLSLSGTHQDAQAYQLLARINRPVEGMAKLAKGILNNVGEPINSRISAGYASYHLQYTAGQYNAAFETLTNANNLQSSQVDWSTKRQEEQAERLIAFFSPAFFERHGATSGYDGEGAVFIVGMPRSGTTLTEQILAAHPKVEPRGELYAVRHALKSISDYPRAIGEMGADWAKEAGGLVHSTILQDSPAGNLATDKQPTSYHHIGLIRHILPKARFIFCHRNPYDNAISLYEQNFGRSHPYVCDLTNIKHTIVQHYKIMKHWIVTCSTDMCVVDYDDLVAAPENNIRDLLKGLELDWHDACLAPHLVERSVSTASDWQVRQPITSSSAGRWRLFENEMLAVMGNLPTWDEFLTSTKS